MITEEMDRFQINKAYQIISELRDKLELQRAEFEKTLNEGYEEAYQLILKERQMHEHIFALLKDGHDIGFNACVNLFTNEEEGKASYIVEVYDPQDDDTQEPFHKTFYRCELLHNFTRRGDFLDFVCEHPEEAVITYLQLVEWVRQSPKQ